MGIVVMVINAYYLAALNGSIKTLLKNDSVKRMTIESTVGSGRLRMPKGMPDVNSFN